MRAAVLLLGALCGLDAFLQLPTDRRGALRCLSAEIAEDDAKRAAEQLKGIIHDTDGATCVCSAPAFC